MIYAAIVALNALTLGCSAYTIATLRRLHKRLRATYTVSSGRGGWHIS